MAWYDSFVEQGAVPAGIKPKVIPQGGGVANYDNATSLGRLNQTIMKLRLENQAENELRMKKAQKKMDMYKTLRESGYAPDRAFTAVEKLEFPDEAGGITAEETKGKLTNEKIQADTERIKATTDKIKSNKMTLRQKILNKIAAGETLTVGEQKVYDETIKRSSGSDSGDELKSLLAEDEGGDMEEMIKVTDPEGNKKKIRKKDLQRAIAAGWKRR